jgi:hypothetical protein
VAQRPDGKAAKTQATSFTRPAAGRIVKVVRKVEAGDRKENALSFQRVGGGGSGGKAFRVCTFTGAWSISASKTVTFKYQTTTPNTVSATNLFWPVPDGEERDCAIARDGTTWCLIVPQMYAANYATAATITTAAIEFKTLPGVALATSSTVVFTLQTIDCEESEE